MKHFLLIYDFVDDYIDRRPAFRDAHLAAAWAAADRGEMLLGGALAEPVDTGLLLFAGETADVADAFARADPYVTHDLVKSWKVRPWTTVAGPMAATPIRG